MANYDIPEYVDKRLRYFNGQFLEEQDFVDEQKYHIGQQRLHNRLHTPGIIAGLEIDGKINDEDCTVKPGAALDGKGQQIVLTRPQSPNKVVVTDSNITYVVVISYGEKTPTDHDPRFWEEPLVQYAAEKDGRVWINGKEAPDDTYIQLGRVKFNQERKIENLPDLSVRQNAGAVIGSVTEFSELKFKQEEVTAQQPTLKSAPAQFPGRVDLTGALVVKPTAETEVKSKVRFYVCDDKSNTSTSGDQIKPEDHIVIFENTAKTNSPGILALKSNVSQDNEKQVPFISFYRGDALIGQFNMSLGSAFEVAHADYAEWLPRLYEAETIKAGHLVGVWGGKVTKTTRGAPHVMAISSAAALVGNMPDAESRHLYEKVAFIGQAPIYVRGPVQIDDYIVPSGDDDGVGIAVAPQELRPQQIVQIVGRAWECSIVPEVKLINTVVGLPVGAEMMELLGTMQAEIRMLKAELEQLRPKPRVRKRAPVMEK